MHFNVYMPLKNWKLKRSNVLFIGSTELAKFVKLLNPFSKQEPVAKQKDVTKQKHDIPLQI